MTQTVAEFFAGKTVFLTGATGFIGKVLLEKLMRSCPDVGNIYCLVRPKEEVSGSQRLTEMFEETLYDGIRASQPDFASRVHCINGDMLDPGLGISETDKQLLEENVQIVLHSAATVRFDEPLKLAVQMNLIAVKYMIELVRGFSKMLVMVHISTAYANCDRPQIDEVIYPPPIDPLKIMDTIGWMNDEMADLITAKLLGEKPNTYTFTKQLAETLLVQMASDLPIAIVRPSIVTASWREPLPGWIDNINGPSGLYIATGKGLLRSMIGDSKVVADIIPVDLPVNMMLAVAWYTAVKKPQNLNVYHITTGGLNPFTWGEMESMVTQYFKRNPMGAAFRRPQVRIFTQNSLLHDLWVLVSHLIPAYTADLGYKLIGKKPRMVAIYNKLHKAMSTLEYFTMREWEWTHNNMDLLKQELSADDQKEFYFDPRSMHWPTYIENYCLGTKKFILKEDISDLPAARAHLRKLRNIRYLFNTVLLVVLWRTLIARSNLARNSWYLVMGLVFKFVRFFRITSTITTS